MVKLVSKIISKIKHREYKIDENITDKDLFSIVATRFFYAHSWLFCHNRV